jgi:hypothetical protein
MKSIFNFDTQLLLQAFGLIFIVIGLVARMGLWKKWYWRSKGTVYSYIPLGLIFLLYSYNDLASARLGASFWLYQLSYIIPVAVGIWWVVRTPAFIKPDWVRWVEAYPEPVYQAMQQAAQDNPDWESHVTSPEKVQAWAKSLERVKSLQKAKSKT